MNRSAGVWPIGSPLLARLLCRRRHNRCVADVDKDFWTPEDVADYLGVQVDTVHTYRVRARWEAEEGVPEEERKGLPAEDKMFGRTPVWRPGTIIAWKEGGNAMTEGDSDASWWTMADIASYLGVKLRSVHTYRTRGIKERASGVPEAERKGLPEEDKMFGRTPVWRPQTVIAWNENQRPGQGVGGGRPSHRSHS